CSSLLPYTTLFRSGQSFAGPVWDSAGSASIGQGDRQSAVDERRVDLDQSRMLHGLEHLTFVDVDEAEFAVAERAASVDDRGGAGLMSGALDVGETDRLSADCLRRRR